MLSVGQRQDTMLIEKSSNVFILYGLKDERLHVWWLGGWVCVCMCLHACGCVFVFTYSSACMLVCIYYTPGIVGR